VVIESFRELRRVAWPERAVAVQNTAVVLAAVAGMLMLLVLVDAFGMALAGWIQR
jgi:preprotein translocase SecE subunit